MRRSSSLVAVCAAVWVSWACGSSDTGGEDANGGGGTDAGAGAPSTGGSVTLGGTNATSGEGNVVPPVGGEGPMLIECSGIGATCVKSSECCSGVCDPASNACASVVGTCGEEGDSCSAGTDCCTFHCDAGGKCSAELCTSDAGECAEDADCCSGSCVDGSCAALNLECKTAGNACGDDGECCSGSCGDQGVCTLGGSYCLQPGDACTNARDCCTGDCAKADGALLGTCAAPPAGSAFCSGVDGVLCGDCGDCCSRLCAPFGPTGVNICQPANGCHVTGDLCRRNEDCCGGSTDETLPGYGNVVCDIEPGKAVGLCRNPSEGPGPGGACNPQGNVCHFQGYSCDISSARANCCGGLGANGGVCQLDPLGVPRCNGLGDECRAAGDTCASTDDCCDDRPCVPDSDGVLRCGSDECQPSGDSCTVNADCCPGGVCVLAPGSTVGTCGGEPTTSGGEGGATGTGGSGSTGICAEYGQLCTESSECCNDVPCSSGVCRFPVK